MEDSKQNRILQNQNAIEMQRDASANLQKFILLYIMLFNHAYIHFVCDYKEQSIHLKIIPRKKEQLFKYLIFMNHNDSVNL